MNAALRAAEATGLDARALAAAARVDHDAILHDGRVPHGQSERLYTLAAEAAGEPAYGLRIGAHSDPFDHGELSVLLMTSTSGIELLELQRRFACFWHDALHVEWERVGVELRILLSFVGLRVSRVVEDAILAAIVGRARGFAGSDFNPAAVWLTREPPADAAPYARYFRCPVHFAMPTLAVVVPASFLDIQLPSGGLNAFIAHTLRARLEAMRPAPSFVEQLRCLLREAGDGADWTASALAKRLGCSKKTLDRRLSEEGTTFRAVVNDLRYELAQSALRGDAKLESVASALGFSDLRAFTRAFRRWSGSTPSAYRARSGCTS